MIESLKSFLPLIAMGLGVSVIVWGAHWLLIGRHDNLGKERKFTLQLIMLGLTLLGLLAVILVLPVSEDSQSKLLGLMGIILSGILAFSSTTIVANLAAGLLLRITKPFRTGDFIRIGEHFGRVSERGLFDTEIQTETRELVALPNTYCISHPVTTIRSSGTIISASLSLGYDVDRFQVESLLVEAATRSGLDEPYVHILELGNFAVTYRVSGLLSETKLLISARSKLYGAVLDVLHAQGVEIMSATYMNQRQLNPDTKAIPSSVPVVHADATLGSVEVIAFDKAERAEELENQVQVIVGEIQKLKESEQALEDEKDKEL